MKKIAFLAVCLGFLCLFLPGAFAESSIVESPGIKIFIDGSPGAYSNVPIITNGRTLLPLREILTKLGIQNDDRHILWNGSDGSVTVLKDSTEVYLKVGSGKATVNGTAVDLDVPPVNYKGRVYIPARFIAQSLGKKVAWDDYTKRVYIRDEGEYNQVEEILAKAVAATDTAEKIRLDIASSSKITPSKRASYETKNTYVEYRDRTKDIIHSLSDSDYGDFSSRGEFYYTNRSSYSQIAMSGSVSINPDEKWDKQTYTEEKYSSIIGSYDAANLINPRDVAYAGLLVEEDEINGQLILKGDIYPITRSAQKEAPANSRIGTVSNTYLEVHINKDTNYITKIITKYISEIIPASAEPFVSDNSTTYAYSDFNGSFTIDLPEYIANDTGKDVEPAETALSGDEKAVVANLDRASEKIPVDGLYNNPYGLKKTEAALFVVLKTAGDFDAYNQLGEDARKNFLNDAAQANMGEYLGCEVVHAFLVFQGKKYARVDTSYNALPESLTITPMDGESVSIVVQDKQANTYRPYSE